MICFRFFLGAVCCACARQTRFLVNSRNTKKKNGVHIKICQIAFDCRMIHMGCFLSEYDRNRHRNINKRRFENGFRWLVVPFLQCSQCPRFSVCVSVGGQKLMIRIKSLLRNRYSQVGCDKSSESIQNDLFIVSAARDAC